VLEFVRGKRLAGLIRCERLARVAILFETRRLVVASGHSKRFRRRYLLLGEILDQAPQTLFSQSRRQLLAVERGRAFARKHRQIAGARRGLIR
jgi:hypothetical protein